MYSFAITVNFLIVLESFLESFREFLSCLRQNLLILRIFFLILISKAQVVKRGLQEAKLEWISKIRARYSSSNTT